LNFFVKKVCGRANRLRNYTNKAYIKWKLSNSVLSLAMMCMCCRCSGGQSSSHFKTSPEPLPPGQTFLKQVDCLRFLHSPVFAFV